MRAISLISGGLDSELATRIILQQGIEIIGLNFTTPFCLCNKKGGCRNEAIRVANKLGIKLKIVFLSDEYLQILKNPKFGYGKNLNPCIDCRILMFKYAKKIMNETKASFIVTGEVLGQRPKSQYLKALKIIERESELEGLILRPLSAKVLPISIPEKEGWVDREKLLGISGRQRKTQINLAKFYNINDYPCPSGGCLLTYKEFANKVRDLLKYNNEILIKDINILKIGRHFRLSDKFKVVIGRNKNENEKLLKIFQEEDKNIYCFIPAENIKGPVGIGIGSPDANSISLFVNILATYCDSTENEVKIFNLNEKKFIIGKKILFDELQKYRI